MLQLTPSPQRKDSPEMLNHKLCSKNRHIVDIIHKSAAIVPGLFVKQSITEFILPFETVHISSPKINQQSKQELVRVTRATRRSQISLVHRQNSFPEQPSSLQIYEQSINSPQSSKQKARVPQLCKVNSWNYSKEVPPHTHKSSYIIEQNLAYQFKPISKSLLFQLEEEESVSQRKQVLNISQHQVEQQQFKDLRQSTSKLQKEPQNKQAKIEIEIFSPINCPTKRALTSRESFIHNSKNSSIKQILSRKTQDNTTLKLLVIKDDQAFNAIWPQYYAKFAQNESALMAAKRTSNALSTTYIISISPRDFYENSGYYLGKIKSNLKGNIFNVYGPGLNPKNAHSKHAIPRQLIATIAYEDNTNAAQKQLKFYIKKQQYHYYLGFQQVKMYEKQVSLDNLYLHSQNKQKIDVFSSSILVQNRRQEKMGANQHANSKPTSQSKLVFEDPLTREKAVTLAKVENSIHNLSISSPFSPLVGFALALISFNFKS